MERNKEHVAVLEQMLEAGAGFLLDDEERAALTAAIQSLAAGEAVDGAVLLDGGVSLVRIGSEDDWCRHQGARRLYASPVAVEGKGAAVERMARVVAKIAGEDFDAIGEFAQSVLMDTQRAALEAALHPNQPEGASR